MSVLNGRQVNKKILYKMSKNIVNNSFRFFKDLFLVTLENLKTVGIANNSINCSSIQCSEIDVQRLLKICNNFFLMKLVS